MIIMYLTPYVDWFKNRKEHEERFFIFAQDPKTITSSSILREDNKVSEYIKDLECLISNLKKYRTDLARRYNEIEVMPYKTTLSIKRNRGYKKEVSYTVKITRVYEDGTEDCTLLERYSGKDRHIAIKRFDTLAKGYPGIECEKDIAKRSWER